MGAMDDIPPEMGATPAPLVPTARQGLVSRMIRALKLDSTLYEEVEHDPKANTETVYVIVIVSIAQAIGLLIRNLIVGGSISGVISAGVGGFITTIVGLAIWSYLLYFVGTKLFHGVATPGEVWRSTGYARSPGIFLIIPIVGFVVNIWILVAYIIAARQSLDLTTGKAIAAVIVSAIPYIIILGFLSLFLS